MVGDELLARQDDPAEHAALAVDVLGRRIDDAIGAELQGMLKHRRREHVVDHERRAMTRARFPRRAAMSMISSVGLVGLSRNAVLVFGPHRGAPGVEIRAVDQRRGDAEARQQLLDHVKTRAEQRLGGDDVVARFELAHQRGGDRRHAARGRARRLSALEQRHAAFEHRDRRVGEARIDEARIVALEARFGRSIVS